MENRLKDDQVEFFERELLTLVMGLEGDLRRVGEMLIAGAMARGRRAKWGAVMTDRRR